MPQEETVETAESSEVEETAVEVTELSLSELEAQMNADFDRERGRDVSKFNGYKAPDKTTEKKEAATTDDAKKPAEGETKEAPKADDEKEEPKKLTRFERRVLKATRVNQEENRALREELAQLKAGAKPKEAAVSEESPLVEPKRESYTTDAEYFAAVRAFDKAANNAEIKRLETEAAQRADNATFQARVDRYNGQITEVSKKFDDWNEVMGKADGKLGRETGDKVKDAEYNTTIVGVLMESGPETSYQLAKISKGAESLSKLDLTGVIAAGNADDPQRVILHLAAHPEDVRSLNGMNPVKAQNFIGKIEARLEAAATSEKTKATPKAEVKDTTPSNGTPKKTEAAKPEPSKEVATKPKKPEPPPALKGGAPSADSWKDANVSSLQEFERLYNEDPANRRR